MQRRHSYIQWTSLAAGGRTCIRMQQSVRASQRWMRHRRDNPEALEEGCNRGQAWNHHSFQFKRPGCSARSSHLACTLACRRATTRSRMLTSRSLSRGRGARWWASWTDTGGTTAPISCGGHYRPYWPRTCTGSGLPPQRLWHPIGLGLELELGQQQELLEARHP